MSSPGWLAPGGSKITGLKLIVDVLICTALVNDVAVIPSMVGRREAHILFEGFHCRFNCALFVQSLHPWRVDLEPGLPQVVHNLCCDSWVQVVNRLVNPCQICP